MGRMHGEHKKDFAARQFARTVRASTAEPISGGPQFPMACPCAAHPHPHIHSLDGRRSGVLRWNRESKHKIPIPKV